MNSKILDKIKALLAKAQSTDSPEEAESFFVHAQKLMVEHRITQADLKEEDPDTLQFDEVSAYEFRLEGELELILAKVIFHTNGCEMVRNKSGQKFRICGESQDVMLVKYLYETTRDTFRRLSKVMWKKNQHNTFTKKNQYIRSFLVGACNGLAEVIKRMTAEVVRDTGASQYALVLANKVERARAHIMQQGGVKMSRNRGGTAGSADGYGDGREVGRNHKLNRPLHGGASSTKLLG